MLRSMAASATRWKIPSIHGWSDGSMVDRVRTTATGPDEPAQTAGVAERAFHSRRATMPIVTTVIGITNSSMAFV